MKAKYYSFEEIKESFISYRDLNESVITDEEYDMFCDEIQLLPKEIVDRVCTEIQFVLLSADPIKGNPACYLNLREGIDAEREGLIVLTPYIFGAPHIDKNGIERRLHRCDQPSILHEIAHHILGHYTYVNPTDAEKKEKAAWERAEKWYRDWTESISKEKNNENEDQDN